MDIVICLEIPRQTKVPLRSNWLSCAVHAEKSDNVSFAVVSQRSLNTDTFLRVMKNLQTIAHFYWLQFSDYLVAMFLKYVQV